MFGQLINIVLSSFISYIYGKNADSVLSNLYTKTHNLYLSYTVDIPLYNSFCIMFLSEFSKSDLNKNLEKSLSFSLLSEYDFLKQKESFKVFIALNDLSLREFGKFLLHSNISGKINIIDYYELVDKISFEKIKQILYSGDISDY